MMRRDYEATPEQKAAGAGAYRKRMEEQRLREEADRRIPPAIPSVGGTTTTPGIIGGGLGGTQQLPGGVTRGWSGTPLPGGGQPPGGGGKGGSMPGTSPTTTSNVTPDMLSRFGYQGRMGVNPFEQMGLGLTAGMAGQQRPMQTALQAQNIYGNVGQGGTSQIPLGTMQPGQGALNTLLGGGALVPSQTGIATGMPAESLYGQMIGGEFAPQGQQFREDVYGATKTGAMQNLADLQKQMGESFAHRGGYFGGQHAMAQAKLAERTASPLNQLLGQLNLQGFESDVANRMAAAQGLGGLGAQRAGMMSGDIGNILGAASGLTGMAGTQAGALGQEAGQQLQAAGGLGGLAGTQRGIESSMLGDIMGGGQMLTERELQNRQLYQGASDRAYQDWQRARQERMAPMNLISSLLGAQTTQPVVQMPGQSSGGLLGNLLGMGVGAFTGGLGGGLGSSLGGK